MFTPSSRFQLSRAAMMLLSAFIFFIPAHTAWADGQNTVYYIDKNYQRVYPAVESFKQLGKDTGPGWYFLDDSYSSNGGTLISDDTSFPSVIVKDGFDDRFESLNCTAGLAGPPIFYGQSRRSNVDLIYLSGPVVFAGPDFQIKEAVGNATVSIAEGFYYMDESDKVYSGPCSIDSYGGTSFYRVFPYIDADGNTQYRAATILSCADDITDNLDPNGYLPFGTYIITGKFTYNSEIKLSDYSDTYFILADGAKLTVPKISSADCSLTIYGQSKDTGELESVIETYSLDFNGGKFTGYSQSGRVINCKHVTINGGIVSCTSLDDNSIVGSYSVTINGGEVKSTSTIGYAIYSPYGNVILAGGNVTATSTDGDGISAYDHIWLSGSKVYANSYRGSLSIDGGIRYFDGSNTYTGYPDASAIADKTLTPKFPYIDSNGKMQYASATILRSASDIAQAKVDGKLPGGWYFIYGSDFTYDQEITFSGDANIILADGTRLTATAGINAAGQTLNIYGQENDSGTLEASITAKYLNLYGGTFKSGTVTANTLYLSGGILIPSKALSNVSFSTPYLVSGSDTPINSLGSPETYVGKTLSPKCYSYIDVGGVEKQKKVAHVKEVTYANAENAGEITLSDGWYIFKPGDAYVYGIIIPEGDVHLILPESTFHLIGDINLHGKLTIYGQTQNTSFLDVANVYSHLSHTEDIGFNLVSGTVFANHFIGNSDPANSYLNFTVVLSGGTLQEADYKCGLSTADGLYYKDESDNFYYGTFSDAEKTAAAGKTLSPSPKTYSVIFDPNGGEGEMARMFLDYDGDWKSLPDCTFTLTGYAFSKWNTKADGTGEDYNLGQPVQNLAASGESITLYAQWGLDIADFDVTLPDQTLTYGDYEWNNVLYKFEVANNNPVQTEAMGVVVKSKDGSKVLQVVKDYTFGSVKFAEGTGENPGAIGDVCKVEIRGKGLYAGTAWSNAFKVITAQSSGEWGELDWAIDGNGVLSITGSGAMNEASSFAAYPWFNNASAIKSIVIGEGITTIAPYAFAGTDNVNYYGNVISVSLPGTLQSIGYFAFAYCTKLIIDLDNDIPSGAAINEYAFYQTRCVKGTLYDVGEAAGNNDELIAIMAHAISADVTLAGRTLYKDGFWNTLCLPFSVGNIKADEGKEFDGTPLAGAIVMALYADGSSLDDSGCLTINFKRVKSITEGVPYIIRWEKAPDNLESPKFEDVKVRVNPTPAEAASVFGNCKFVGQYEPFAITEANRSVVILLGADNQIGYSADNRTLHPFRAHFEVPLDQAVKRYSISFGEEGEATGIVGTPADPSTKDAGSGYYSIDGRRLPAKPVSKGVYIHNGHKFIVK